MTLHPPMLCLSSPSHQLKSPIHHDFQDPSKYSQMLSPVGSDVSPSIAQEVLGLLFAGFIAEQSQPELFITPAALLGLVEEGMSWNGVWLTHTQQPEH